MFLLLSVYTLQMGTSKFHFNKHFFFVSKIRIHHLNFIYTQMQVWAQLVQRLSELLIYSLQYNKSFRTKIDWLIII